MLLFIKIRKLPKNTNIFKTDIVPLIIIWIVWSLVIMNIFTCSKHSSNFHKFSAVHFLRPWNFFFKLFWNPSSIDNNSTSLNFDGISSIHQVFHWYFTTFIAIKRVKHIVSFLSLWVFGRNQNFLGLIKLTNYIVWFESVVDIKLLFWHSVPSEIHLFPWSDILC